MDFRYILKKGTTYWVFCSNDKPYITQESYPVAMPEEDPNCIYTIAQVEAYLLEHPEHLLDAEAIEAERQKQQEITSLKDYLADTDYIYPKCLELELDVDVVYVDVVAQRKLARNRIQELEV